MLDSEFKTISVLDRFESFIWTDRYSSYGDFELYTLASLELIRTIKNIHNNDYYVWSNISDHVMIVENYEITTDSEYGDHLRITGRSLESILQRRIVWGQTNVTGNLQTKLTELIGNQCMGYAGETRRIPGFTIEQSADPKITSLKIDTQFTGDNLYDAVKKVCDEKKIGFKITLNDENKFVFKLYSGSDRSYDQLENPFVIFSPKFENIINSDYRYNKENYKTVALIGGEGEGSDRTYVVSGDNQSKGLLRKELFVDARDLTSKTEDGADLSASEYQNKLTSRGNEKLSDFKIDQYYDGEIDTSRMFKYNEDFFMGDIVQFESDYAFESRVRITEYIYSESKDGVQSYPTFEFVEEVIE